MTKASHKQLCKEKNVCNEFTFANYCLVIQYVIQIMLIEYI